MMVIFVDVFLQDLVIHGIDVVWQRLQYDVDVGFDQQTLTLETL